MQWVNDVGASEGRPFNNIADYSLFLDNNMLPLSISTDIDNKSDFLPPDRDNDNSITNLPMFYSEDNISSPFV